MDLELSYLKEKTSEELESLLGTLVQPDHFNASSGLPSPPSMPKHIAHNPGDGFSNFGAGMNLDGVNIKSMPQSTNYDPKQTRELGIRYFSENKKKIKQAVCNNQNIRKMVLEQEKPDLNWLIDELIKELDKKFSFPILVKVLATYIGKRGIKKLCDS